jgi:hypothetical protein
MSVSKNEENMEIQSENNTLNLSQNTTDIIMNSNNIENNNSSSKSFVSKRILCELIKSDINETEEIVVNEISKKLDNLIDIILNKCENQLHYIQYFMCYIVEINSELIRMIPEYKDLSEDLNLRFIVPAKNIYNFSIEVFFSIHDLYNIDLNTYMEVFKKKFPFKYEDK